MRWYIVGGDGPDRVEVTDGRSTYQLLPPEPDSGGSVLDLLRMPAASGKGLAQAAAEAIRAGRATSIGHYRFEEIPDRPADPMSRETGFLQPPLNPPAGDIIAIGRNYAEHAGEMQRATNSAPGRPTVFSKAQTTINRPHGDIIIDPKISNQVDWEAELGVVIGVAGRDIPTEKALDHVFGYTVINDVTARDIQYGWGGQYYKGKSVDGYCPIGPWIVTADDVPDPQNLEITLRVNGVEKQRGHTRDMIYSVAEIISQLSVGQTLRPGTLIATGTPPGVGYAREPKEFLRPGDVMETEIAGIGVLRNRIVASDPGIYETPLNPGG